MATKVLRKPTGGAILQVRIELRGTKPKVWRRVLVPQTITLLKLHLVIQAAFGWEHSHLHEFIAGDGKRYGSPDPMYDSPGSINSENTMPSVVSMAMSEQAIISQVTTRSVACRARKLGLMRQPVATRAKIATLKATAIMA